MTQNHMKEARIFDELGYVVVKNLLTPSQIDTLTKLVDRVFSLWLAENRADVLESRLINMHSLTSPPSFEHCEAERLSLFQAIASDNLTELVDGMFGDGIYFHNTQLFFNPADKNKRPYWHRDMQYTPIDDAILKNEQGNMLALHARLPLVAERGIELIPGTHQRWDTDLERTVRFELNGHRNSEDLPGAVLIDLVPGDVLIFDAQMIHRGNYHLNELRKAFDICLGKTHPLTAEYLDESVLPSADELERIANPRWYRLAKEIAANSKITPRMDAGAMATGDQPASATHA